MVLFSAAIPAQGGTGHVNERWPGYSRALFAARGYRIERAKNFLRSFDYLRLIGRRCSAGRSPLAGSARGLTIISSHCALERCTIFDKVLDTNIGQFGDQFCRNLRYSNPHRQKQI
jgi:hypothetical protein